MAEAAMVAWPRDKDKDIKDKGKDRLALRVLDLEHDADQFKEKIWELEDKIADLEHKTDTEMHHNTAFKKWTSAAVDDFENRQAGYWTWVGTIEGRLDDLERKAYFAEIDKTGLTDMQA